MKALFQHFCFFFFKINKGEIYRHIFLGGTWAVNFASQILTSSASATGWGLWWTRACTTCRAANCSSSFPIGRTYRFLSTAAKTTCPGPSTRTRPDTSSCAPATRAPFLGIAQEVVPEAVGCPVRSSPTHRSAGPSCFCPQPKQCCATVKMCWIHLSRYNLNHI